MNRAVFMDTGAFIALANGSDQYHAAAKNCLQELTAAKRELVTSNFVLDETYTRIRRKAGVKTAVTFGEQVQTNRALRIITIDRAVEKRAWETFKKFADQTFSYTDCTSFALMKGKKIDTAFSFDKDFRIMGFQVIPA